MTESTPDRGDQQGSGPQPPAPQPGAGAPQEQPHAERAFEQPAPQQPYQQQPYAQQPYQQQPYQQEPYGQAGYAQQQWSGGPQYAYAPRRPTNSMAVVSLVAGIAGLTMLPLVGSIVAVITGHMARREIARTGEEGSGLVTAGLVTGWVGIGIAALVALFFLLMLVFGFGLFATVATATSGV